MSPEASRPSDHDLLIELNTKFSSFETASDRMWRDVNDKMSRLLLQMEGKADKQEVQYIKQSVEKLEVRVQNIEMDHTRDNTKKETVINLGNIGIKTWVFISGVILFAIAMWNTFNGKG